jgi:DNA-binding response OmpR family regulator
MARILIVDDDELIAQIATEALIDAGHACGWVPSGEAALDLLKTGKRPSLLLLDQTMPGISGINLLRELRGSPKHYDLPVIMFTTMSGRDDEARAIFAGAQDFIRKPFDRAVLINRVDRLLARRQTASDHKPLHIWLAESTGWATADTPARRRMI